MVSEPTVETSAAVPGTCIRDLRLGTIRLNILQLTQSETGCSGNIRIENNVLISVFLEPAAGKQADCVGNKGGRKRAEQLRRLDPTVKLVAQVTALSRLYELFLFSRTTGGTVQCGVRVAPARALAKPEQIEVREK
uniref:Uncharacterized protein n=1 Tax=Anopheles culicifacies TaxID=139723 RepID=A0A182ML89_9DIPT